MHLQDARTQAQQTHQVLLRALFGAGPARLALAAPSGPAIAASEGIARGGIIRVLLPAPLLHDALAWFLMRQPAGEVMH